GLAPGYLKAGPRNTITDVPGVKVGQVTLSRPEDGLQTGVTAILPHAGPIFEEKVPAGIAVGNGHGKIIGTPQLEELGELETPILVTNTLSVADAASGLVGHILDAHPQAISVNPVVGEINDARLNDIRQRRVEARHVAEALSAAGSGPVLEGSVGAGAGAECYGWKGGVGTASRQLELLGQKVSVGVLVVANIPGLFTPGGKKLPFSLQRSKRSLPAGGSIVAVLATDASLCGGHLKRVATRSLLGIARTGSPMVNSSGEFAIAFSSASDVRISRGAALANVPRWPNEHMDPLFQAAIDASEEAVLNAMIAAQTVTTTIGTLERFPFEEVFL
ncbi:MAG: P1 family peptidase, partial [Pseudomonadota bacterium]